MLRNERPGFTYTNAQPGQLTQITDSKGGSPLWTFSYGRDALGQVGSSDPLDGPAGTQHSYSYDPLNRLSSDQTEVGSLSWMVNQGEGMPSVHRVDLLSGDAGVDICRGWCFWMPSGSSAFGWRLSTP